MTKTPSSKSTKNSDFIDQLNAELNAGSPEEGTATERAKTEDFAAMLGESFRKPTKKLSVGDKIRGEILVLGKEDVFVATGAQHDGVITRRELNNPDGTCDFKQGDMIDLYVTLVRGSDIRLSRNPTDKNIAEDLEDAFDMELPIQGRIVEVCKGGVRVNIRGKIAFCPISQIDVKHIETPDEYVGKSYEFRITQFSEGGRNIVVSRRKLLEEERELSSASFLEENKDGDVVEGKVARLEKFGAFVELAPGVDGLVHVSEMAWSRVGDPSEVVQVGQQVTVKILRRETVNGKVKISLSMKQATDRPAAPARDAAATGGAQSKDDPWSKFSVGQIVTGKVNRKELYGLFVQLEPGITGLLHKSTANDQADFNYDKLKVNDTVTVQIGEIKLSERRISLQPPRDPNEDDWRNHVQPQTASSLGTFGGALGAQLKAAMDKNAAEKKKK